MNKKEIKVKCPQCSKDFSYYSSEFRPFCSEICRQIDLGHWLLESYTIPVVKSDEEKEQDALKELDEQDDT